MSTTTRTSSNSSKRADLPVEVMVAGAMGEELERDAKLARDVVQALRLQHPSATRDELCWKLLVDKLKFAALAGLLCALPIFLLRPFPPFFMLFAITLLAAVDAMCMLKLCVDLILQVQCVTTAEGESVTRVDSLMTHVLTIAGLGGLASSSARFDEMNEKVTRAGEVILLRSAVEFAKRLVLILSPKHGIPLCIAWNMYELYAIGHGAKRSSSSAESYLFLPFLSILMKKIAPPSWAQSFHQISTKVGREAKAYVAKTWGRALRS